MPRQERARPAIAALLALAVLTSGCLSLSTDDEADPEPQTIDPRDGPSSSADAWMFGGPLTSQQLADRVAEHLVG
jgi:hypothetical protein